MNISTPKKRINTNNHIPMPLTYSLYRSSALFKHQHQLLSSLNSPFMPSLRVQKKVSEFNKEKNLKTDNLLFGMNQQNQVELQMNHFLTQLLEPSKNQSLNQIQIDTNNVQQMSVILLNKKGNQKITQKSEEQEYQEHQAPIKDIFNWQQQITQLDTKSILTNLKLGDCFKIQSQIPEEVTNLYQKYNKNNQKMPNFTQGYLKKIDCIYYAVEKNLILHFPCGPRKSQFGIPNTNISVILPDILYNIVQTELKLKLFSQTCNNKNGQVLIMCHPYYIQLYYLPLPIKPNNYCSSQIKNPIQKLNIRYFLPNCARPHLLGVLDPYIYYLPHKSSIKLEYICLKTGQIKRMDVERGKSKKIFNPSECIKYKKIENREQIQKKQNGKMGKFLLSKLATLMMYSQPEGLLHRIGQKIFINTLLKKIIICQHNNKIGCIIEQKIKKSIEKLFIQQNIKYYNYSKLVRMYQKINNNKYTYQDILFDNNNIQIINIQFINNNNNNKNNNQCNCQIKLLIKNKQNHTIEQYIHIQSNKNISNIIKLSPKYQQQQPILIKTTKSIFIKQQNTLSVISHNKYSTNNNSHLRASKYNLFTENNPHTEQYIHTDDSYITICTDIGYTRLLFLNWIDLLHSAINYYINKLNIMQTIQDLASMASYFIKLTLDSFTRYQTHPKNKLIAIIKLLNGLLQLSSSGQMYERGLLYKNKSTNISIRPICWISDKIQKACISLLNYYSVYLNKFIIEIMQPKQINDLLQNTYQKTDKKQQKSLIFNYHQIQQYIYKQQPNKQQQYHLSIKQKNKKQEQCLLQEQFKCIKIKTLKQQQQNKCHHVQSSAFACRVLYKYSFFQQLVTMLKPIWNQCISNVSLECIQNLLDKLDKMTIITSIVEKSLGFPIFQMYYRQINTKQDIYSPNSTVAHSIQEHTQQLEQNTTEKYQQNKQNTLIEKICQLLMMAQIIHNQCANLRFKDIMDKQPSYFGQYIFNKFVEDYDSQLLMQFQKAIPIYMNAKYERIQYGTDYAYHMPVKFWLMLVVDICGVMNKVKILIIMQKRLQEYNLVRMHEIINKKIQKEKKQNKSIIMPEYFIKYLWKSKGITFNDFHIKNLKQLDHIKVPTHSIQDKKTQINKNKIKNISTSLQKNKKNQDKSTQLEFNNNNNKTKKPKQAMNLSEIIQNKPTQRTK